MEKRVAITFFVILLIIVVVYLNNFSDVGYSPEDKEQKIESERVEVIEVPLQGGVDCLFLEGLSPNSFQEGINYVCETTCSNEDRDFVSATCVGDNLNCGCVDKSKKAFP